MMANAICLRIAALPVSDAVPLETAIGCNDWTGAFCTDREGSGETVSRSHSIRHQGEEPCPPSIHRHRVNRTKQHSRSLSCLSLTLWCVAPRSGWLGSCASPLQGWSERSAIGMEEPVRSYDPAGTDGWRSSKKRLRRERWARSQPSLLRESRTCPVFR